MKFSFHKTEAENTISVFRDDGERKGEPANFEEIDRLLILLNDPTLQEDYSEANN